jgi:hypothetical protein
MPDIKPYKPPYVFSVTSVENCARQLRTFADLAEALKIDVTDLMSVGATKPGCQPRSF